MNFVGGSGSVHDITSTSSEDGIQSISKGISDLNEQETKTLQEFASNVGSSVLERVLDRLQSLNTNSGRSNSNSNSNQNQAAVGVNM
jgi:hypothetical protein